MVGDPVAHSRSPDLHMAAYAALDIDATYVALRVPFGAFGTIARDLRTGHLDGVNVTMPHKTHAHEEADRVTEEASRTRAVNTITVTDGDLVGHNTDVAGVVYAMEVARVEPDERVVVLGAGGAARAAIVACADRVTVMARTSSHSADALRSTAVTGDILDWGVDVSGAVIVNATPLGMHGERLPETVLASASALVDMAYGTEPTPAVRWAQRHGLRHADGLDMLVGQAATAFTLFVGEDAPIEAMEAAVRH